MDGLRVDVPRFGVVQKQQVEVIGTECFQAVLEARTCRAAVVALLGVQKRTAETRGGTNRGRPRPLAKGRLREKELAYRRLDACYLSGESSRNEAELRCDHDPVTPRPCKP